MGLLVFGDYLFNEKYKDRMPGGFVSAVHDGIIRAFFAPGLNAQSGQPDNCTLDPTLNTVTSSFLLGQYDGPKFVKVRVEVSSSHPREELEPLLSRASAVCYVSNTLRAVDDVDVVLVDPGEDA